MDSGSVRMWAGLRSCKAGLVRRVADFIKGRPILLGEVLTITACHA